MANRDAEFDARSSQAGKRLDGDGGRAGDREADGGDEVQNVSVTAASPASEGDALRAEVQLYRDKYLRAQAEIANVSKRLSQQHAESLKLAGQELARALLPVLDNFHRTMASIEETGRMDPILEGVLLTAQQLEKTLSDFGITPIEALGKPFDPMLHSAVLQDFDTDAPAGTVTQEMERGYRMHDRVLRPARVAVAAERPSAEAR